MVGNIRAVTASILLLASFRSVWAQGDSLVIDSFDYPTAQAAQQAWRAQPPAAPIQLIRRGDGRAGTFFCDWNRLEKRACYDRSVDLNLSRFGRFTFWVYTDAPEAIRTGAIYFESAQGWYAASFAVPQKGWQQVTLDRTDFGAEGSPAGWHRIRTVRLAFWKMPGTPALNTMAAIDQIEAHGAPIVVVGSGFTKADSAGKYSAGIAGLLRKMGLQYTVIDDADVIRGGLDRASLAIFPYNPDMPPAEIEAVARFVSGGGRIMLFYCLPEKLATALGIADGGWMGKQYPGQFAFARFDGKVLEGAPESIQQDSWNVCRPRPLGSRSQIAGQWVNARGEPSGIPAATISPAGLYMGHVLTGGDDVAKQRFLLATIAALLPQWRPQLARTALHRAQQEAGFADTVQMRRFVDSQRRHLPGNRASNVDRLLNEAQELFRAADDRLSADPQGSFGSTLASADKAHQLLQEALYLSFPSWRPDFRGVWCHSALGVPGWSWDQTIGHLKNNGFNAIVVNMVLAGSAFYPSAVLPPADDVRTRGDQLAECLAACRKHGVELHVWKTCFNLQGARKEFVDRMRREGRLQADRAGREVPWLSPSHPANFQLERDAMLEVVRRYAVDGIHFDYIRYPDSQADYSRDAQQRFEQAAGVRVKRWPDDVVSGPHAAAFGEWRRAQITRLVREVSTEARKIRPGTKVSAAVFPDYKSCRESVAQDWAAWVQSGYLDFVCPMNYTASDAEFAGLLKDQLRLVGSKARLYPGVGVTATQSNLSPVQTAQKLMIARQLGANGFVLFNYGLSLANQHVPALRKGMLAE
jgi:uncharacterized lipoprotein YddW (UPF0748 family)